MTALLANHRYVVDLVAQLRAIEPTSVYNKGDKSAASWSREALEWIDKWTFYRPLADNRRLIGPHFNTRDFGADYLLYRPEHHRHLRRISAIARWPVFRPFLRSATFRLAGLVWVLERK